MFAMEVLLHRLYCHEYEYNSQFMDITCAIRKPISLSADFIFYTSNRLQVDTILSFCELNFHQSKQKNGKYICLQAILKSISHMVCLYYLINIKKFSYFMFHLLYYFLVQLMVCYSSLFAFSLGHNQKGAKEST